MDQPDVNRAESAAPAPSPEEPPQAPSGRSPAAQRVSALADRFVLWLSKHWLAVLNSLALAYVGLPLLAPILMALGLEWPARIIHMVYRPLCHQLPQRSFFLFGQQLTYRFEQLAMLAGAEITESPWSGGYAGDAVVGYKTALCQRDMAIYGMILVGGLIFGFLRRRRRVRPMPIWLYIVVGVLPMLVDGGYQWISYALATLVPSLGFLPHETTPNLRVITGSLFGLSTVWLAYPHVQDTMDEVRASLEAKEQLRAEAGAGRDALPTA